MSSHHPRTQRTYNVPQDNPHAEIGQLPGDASKTRLMAEFRALCETFNQNHQLSRAYYSTLVAAHRWGLLDWEETGLPFGVQQGNDPAHILRPPQLRPRSPLFLPESLSDFMSSDMQTRLTMPPDHSNTEVELLSTDYVRLIGNNRVLKEMCDAEWSTARGYEDLLTAAVRRHKENHPDFFQ